MSFRREYIKKHLTKLNINNLSITHLDNYYAHFVNPWDEGRNEYENAHKIYANLQLNSKPFTIQISHIKKIINKKESNIFCANNIYEMTIILHNNYIKLFQNIEKKIQDLFFAKKNLKSEIYNENHMNIYLALEKKKHEFNGYEHDVVLTKFFDNDRKQLKVDSIDFVNSKFQECIIMIVPYVIWTLNNKYYIKWKIIQTEIKNIDVFKFKQIPLNISNTNSEYEKKTIMSKRTDRSEQCKLRNYLIKNKEPKCIICNEENNVECLQAAHLKEHKILDNAAEVDDENIVEFMCASCHLQYDKGFISVNSGKLIISQENENKRYHTMNGKKIEAYNKKNESYFKWHFDNIFKN